MLLTSDKIKAYITSHRCYQHSLFFDWAKANPSYNIVAPCLHQIRCFCDSTRIDHNFSTALRHHGYTEEADLQNEIVESESTHYDELLIMAAYIVNCSAKKTIIHDINDVIQIGYILRITSNLYFCNVPNYNQETGLIKQTREAIDIFEKRKKTDLHNTWRNIGATIALETISHQQLIPGEKHAFVDSGIYGITLEDPPMHYLKKHWGEHGAEKQHETNAYTILDAILDDGNARYIMEGISGFLDSVAALWDRLDEAILMKAQQPH